MVVHFYSAKFRKNELNKSLGTAITKNLSVKDGISLEDPVLYLDNSAVINANYCYIPDFNRYYFITGQELDGKTLYLTCHVDVLMTYKNDIRTSNGTATRSNFYNKNIPDSMAIEIPQQKITYRKLSATLTGETYVCIIGG